MHISTCMCAINAMHQSLWQPLQLLLLANINFSSQFCSHCQNDRKRFSHSNLNSKLNFSSPFCCLFFRWFVFRLLLLRTFDMHEHRKFGVLIAENKQKWKKKNFHVNIGDAPIMMLRSNTIKCDTESNKIAISDYVHIECVCLIPLRQHKLKLQSRTQL